MMYSNDDMDEFSLAGILHDFGSSFSDLISADPPSNSTNCNCEDDGDGDGDDLTFLEFSTCSIESKSRRKSGGDKREDSLLKHERIDHALAKLEECPTVCDSSLCDSNASLASDLTYVSYRYEPKESISEQLGNGGEEEGLSLVPVDEEVHRGDKIALTKAQRQQQLEAQGECVFLSEIMITITNEVESCQERARTELRNIAMDIETCQANAEALVAEALNDFQDWVESWTRKTKAVLNSFLPGKEESNTS